MKTIFVKQAHTSFKILFGIVFLICLFLVTLITIRNKHIRHESILIIVFMLAFCILISRFLDGFGLYINGKDIYYKRCTKHIIDLELVRAVKIIKSDFDGKYVRRQIRDIHGVPMYSMIFLSNIENAMYSYQQGDTMFLQEFRNCVLFYTVLDEHALEYLIALKKDIKVIR